MSTNYLAFFHSVFDVSAQCTITPLYPTTLTATGGAVISGTTNVMIQCVCPVTGDQIVRWYNTHKHRLSSNSPYYVAGSPYYIPNNPNNKVNVTLVIPTFNDCHDGTYYCGISVDWDTVGQPSINFTLTVGELMINTVSYLYVGTLSL